MTFTSEQQVVADGIRSWMDGNGPDEITLGGYAGTGKSYVLGALWDELAEGGAAICAPTGKAAQVLAQKGLPASTVHRLIYRFNGIRVRDDGTEEPLFSDEGDWGTEDELPPKRLVIDEASMITDKMARDIRARKLPVLWVGDHGQLSPVGKDPGLMRNPLYQLSSIQRNSADSPIIQLAHRVRQGKGVSKRDRAGDRLKVGEISSDRGVVQYAIENDVDQIIVGTHYRKASINREYRKARGYERSIAVVPGERLLCLKNNYQYHFFNGQIFEARTANMFRGPVSDAQLRYETQLALETIDGWREFPAEYVINCSQMGRTKPTLSDISGAELAMDYGYGITCHKSQGSEWGNVLVVLEQMDYFDMVRWTYTAITRAKERLHVVLRN